jgi:hypothetical protein
LQDMLWFFHLANTILQHQQWCHSTYNKNIQ